jgi:hypothetical protein
MRKEYTFPIHGYAGIILILLFWYLNWQLEGLRTHWGFFPLWLGYCLTIDAFTFKREGNSLATRNEMAYIGLFVISFPFWWLFEILNVTAQYWHYSHRQQFSDLEYFILASISFSTVVPAVFGTSELVCSLLRKVKTKQWIKLGGKKWQQITFFAAGWIMLLIVIFKPQYGAAFLWISIYFIVDPINIWMGNRSLLSETGKGNWRIIWILWIGCLTCGFFWEMWNYYSNPKWFYTVPGVDFWHIFEMPLLGYLGYLPFALELFAMYHFIIGVFKLKGWTNYLKLP